MKLLPVYRRLATLRTVQIVDCVFVAESSSRFAECCGGRLTFSAFTAQSQ